VSPIKPLPGMFARILTPRCTIADAAPLLKVNVSTSDVTMCQMTIMMAMLYEEDSGRFSARHTTSNDMNKPTCARTG
jgi:hypothetical protein